MPERKKSSVSVLTCATYMRLNVGLACMALMSGQYASLACTFNARFCIFAIDKANTLLFEFPKKGKPPKLMFKSQTTGTKHLFVSL